MAKIYRWLGIVIGANVESISILVGTWWFAKLLDNNYPIKFSWTVIFIPLSIILIFKIWVSLFKKLIQDEKMEQDTPKSGKKGGHS